MRARRDLAGGTSDDVAGWVARQGTMAGLTHVDFNHPQHTAGLTPETLRAALDAAGLAAGAVCTRFPDELRAGAFSNPDADLRAKALAIAVDGCAWAQALGAEHLIVWSPFDGYDYNFQADYTAAWARIVAAFRALSASCAARGVRVSLEWKPTDAASRASFVASTAAALLLAKEVDSENFGLTLDVGHLLMAGENPAASVALVGAAGKLFGLQLSDSHGGATEDGLAFASVHATGALELLHWLRRTRYDGVIYFDTFPSNEDPVREAAHNIRRFNSLWARAARLADAGIDALLAAHDAMGALEALEALDAPA
jgi:sugar phosphate isomerase/epimerase